MRTNTHNHVTRHLLAGALALTLCVPMAACANGTQASSTSTADTQTTTTTTASSPTAEVADVTSVSYLGPAGTYTEEAAKLFFGSNDELFAQKTVDDAIALVEDGTATYAVIPQENTLGGPVTDYIDALLASKDARVVGEVVLPIRQTLMGLPGTDLSKVKTVHSHKQGLAQSADWLDKNLPNAERVEAQSTAAAAQEVAEGGDTTSVAIAAPGAADLYHLEVLQENVSQSEANKTRFYVISKQANAQEGYDHAVFVASIAADELPGLLAKACQDGTELVCVHDRPEGSALGTYRYVIELSRKDGFTNAELKRLEDTGQLEYRGRYSCVEG